MTEITRRRNFQINHANSENDDVRQICDKYPTIFEIREEGTKKIPRVQEIQIERQKTKLKAVESQFEDLCSRSEERGMNDSWNALE